jgi:hypothetical protein
MSLRFFLKQQSLATLTLDNSELTEGLVEDGVVGGLLGTIVGSTFELTDDAGDRFKVTGTNIVAGPVATDYGTATSHNITVRETNPSYPSTNDTVLSITVIDRVIPDLNDLTLETNTIASGSGKDTLVGTLLGHTENSTVTMTDTAGSRFKVVDNQVYTGLVATSFASAESHNITVRETFAGASNSPNDTVLTVNVLADSGAIAIAAISGVTDNTPDFAVNWLTSSPQVGWTLRYYVKGLQDVAFSLWHSIVLDAGDIAGPIDGSGATPLDDDTYVVYAVLYNGATELAPSNQVVSVVTVTGDITAPTIVTLSPEDGEPQAAIAASSVMTFNESIVAGAAASFRLTRTGVGQVEELTEADFGTKLVIAGKSLTLNWTSDMLSSTAYNIQWDADSLEDAAGNGIAASAGATDWNFTTIASGSAAATFIGSTSSTSALTTYTFNTVAIGTAVANRRVVVGITARCATSSPAVTSVTCNGNAMSLAQELSTASASSSYAGLYEIVEASGTTCTIVVTFAQAGQSFCSINVFTIADSGGAATDNFESVANPGSGSLTIPVNGCAIGVAMCGCSSATGSFAWTGLETESSDYIPASGNCTSTALSNTAEGDTTITATASGTTLARRVMVAAAWTP